MGWPTFLVDALDLEEFTLFKPRCARREGAVDLLDVVLVGTVPDLNVKPRPRTVMPAFRNPRRALANIDGTPVNKGRDAFAVQRRTVVFVGNEGEAHEGRHFAVNKRFDRVEVVRTYRDFPKKVVYLIGRNRNIRAYRAEVKEAFLHKLAQGAKLGDTHAKAKVGDGVGVREDRSDSAVLARLNVRIGRRHDDFVHFTRRSFAEAFDIRRSRIIDHLENVKTVYEYSAVVLFTDDPFLGVLDFRQLGVSVDAIAFHEVYRTEEVNDLRFLPVVRALRDEARKQAALFVEGRLNVCRVHLDVVFRHGIGGECFCGHGIPLCNC